MICSLAAKLTLSLLLVSTVSLQWHANFHATPQNMPVTSQYLFAEEKCGIARF